MSYYGRVIILLQYYRPVIILKKMFYNKNKRRSNMEDNKHESEERITKLEKDYNSLYNLIRDNLESVTIYNDGSGLNYKDIFRVGDDRGWA